MQTNSKLKTHLPNQKPQNEYTNKRNDNVTSKCEIQPRSSGKEHSVRMEEVKLIRHSDYGLINDRVVIKSQKYGV